MKRLQPLDQSHESDSTPESQSSPGNSKSDSISADSPIDDRPIALRKGKRVCTDHPIYNFVSYERLSPTHRAFISKINKAQVPTTIHEALAVPEWKTAIYEEIQALKKNGTWEISELPSRKRLVGCKWIFTMRPLPVNI